MLQWTSLGINIFLIFRIISLDLILKNGINGGRTRLIPKKHHTLLPSSHLKNRMAGHCSGATMFGSNTGSYVALGMSLKLPELRCLYL